MTTTTRSSPRTTTTGRVANVALWVAQVVAALAFVWAALGKFTGAPEAVATFDAMGAGAWLAYAIGVLEVLGAVALFVPRLTGLAALAFCALMLGAIVTHLLLAPAGVVLPLFLLVLSALIAWGRLRGRPRSGSPGTANGPDPRP